MAELRRSEALAATRQLVVLLRLTVGAQGRVLYGDIVDPDTGAAVPFHGLVGVSRALRTWLGTALARVGPASGEGSELLARDPRREPDERR